MPSREMPREVHHLDPRFFGRVVRAYDSWVTRAYLTARFSIIRRILSDLLRNLPSEATVLNLGSGIGLFDLYGAHHRPASRFVGIDIDASRVAMSRAAARSLGLSNVEFVHGDVTAGLPDLRPDVVIALDLLHHVPPVAQDAILHWAQLHLTEGGRLFVKDVSTEVRWKIRFTKVLDDLMTGGEPVYYFSVDSMRQRLTVFGFTTVTFHLWDYIPFPHVIYAAQKQG